MTSPTDSFASLDDWLKRLDRLSPIEIVLGLERVTAVLDRLQLPRAARVINIAGTNGKGSTAAMLEAMFTNAGYKTGCYTSPHLLRFNERIRIGGIEANDRELIAAFERVEAVREDLPLTYFEYATLAAMVAFAVAGADTLILEVGLGGRLDAVNAVEPDACLITNVSLDHTAWLGKDLQSIANEKAGILRPGKPAVFGTPEHADLIRVYAERTGAELRVAGENFRHEIVGQPASSWSWYGDERELTGLRVPPLPGKSQFGNAAAALALIEMLGFDDMLSREAVDGALADLKLPGRFQVVHAARTWVLDVAHNPAAAAELADSLAGLARGSPVTAIVGMLADKDVAGIVTPLRDLVHTWVSVPLPGSRSAPAALQALQIANATGKPCRIAVSIDAALEQEDRDAAPEVVLLVAGSFYVVGPALEWLRMHCI